ncbi:MAG: Flp pilus assembly protein CpaB [Steroidobacteraceae bacterium]
MNRVTSGLRRVLHHEAALLSLAVVLGAAGAILASRYLAARATAAEQALSSRYASRTVVVAAADLPRGENLLPGHMAARSMPRDFLPPDAVAVEHVDSLVGARTAIAIRRGTPIVSSAVQADADVLSLAGLLAEGERALTLPVDDINSQAGRIQIGDRVDLYYRRTESGNTLLMPLLQQVEVLAAGGALRQTQETENQDAARSYATVTLRVPASEAPRLLLAQQAGEIAVVLRGPQDKISEGISIRNARELLRSPTPGVKPNGAIELLIGGAGELSPGRSWMQAAGATTGLGGTT